MIGLFNTHTSGRKPYNTSMNHYSVLLLIFVLIGCQPQKEVSPKNEYLRWVGDIAYDPNQDSERFKLCAADTLAKQYFNVGSGMMYSGEKSALLSIFQNQYHSAIKDDQNGWIRIRFVVNCKGESGRFRFLQSDFNYKAVEFEDAIKNQLLKLTKGLKGWEPLKWNNKAIDYYQYLIFKIEKGQLTEILP